MAVINVKYSAAEERTIDISFFFFIFFTFKFNIFLSLRIFPAKSHKIILSAWYHPVRFVLFCPQNLDETTRKSSKYTSFSVPGTLGDKVFNRIVREELFEFTIQLRCQCLIMGNNQCRLVQLRYHICHCKCLSGTRNPPVKSGIDCLHGILEQAL